MDDLYQVIDSYFLILQDIPNIREKINLEFDRDEPKDVTFQVNMGKGDYVADNVLRWKATRLLLVKRH